MLKRETVWQIKQLARNGWSLSAIARKVHVSFSTAKKYANFDDGVGRKIYTQRGKKPEKHAILIQKMVQMNATLGKQRLTAKRMYERIRDVVGDPKYSLRTLQRYVSSSDLMRPTVSHVPLNHVEGCAQIDFGTIKGYWGNRLVTMKYLVLVFPYSNRKFAVVLPAENTECLLWGLIHIFEHIGYAPRCIRIDNASTMVTRGKKFVITDTFKDFAAHYGFRIERCNPARGNEKGSVERAVSSLRQAFLSPYPVVNDFDEFNAKLLKDCESLEINQRYGRTETTAELWTEEKQYLTPLPKLPYNPISVESRKTDKCGIIIIDKKRYSTESGLVCKPVDVEIGAFDIRIFRRDGKFVASHKRCYYTNSSIDYGQYIDSFVRYPRALRSAGLGDEAIKRICRTPKHERKALIRTELYRFNKVDAAPEIERYEVSSQKYKVFTDGS